MIIKEKEPETAKESATKEHPHSDYYIAIVKTKWDVYVGVEKDFQEKATRKNNK